MSVKERARLGILSKVEADELTLVQAAGLLGVSYRQVRRLRQRYREHGDAGLVHGLRGRPSNRGGDRALREAAIGLFASITAILVRRWRVNIWLRVISLWWTIKRCGAGCSQRACGVAVAKRRSIVVAASVRRASANWCRSTARTTTGSRVVAPAEPVC